MSFVLVVDQERRPLAPVHPGTARWLLSHGKAAVLHQTPFTLILKRVGVEAPPEPLRLKLYPGSHTTGLAVVNDGTGQVVWAAELAHRGEQVKRARSSAAGCAPESTAAAHALSAAALPQPQAQARVAAAVATEPGAERAHLGGAAAALVCHRCALARTRQI